jgi:hypothetical protein
MDAAATEAAKEFQASWTVAQLAPWLNKWYMSAGYKRLCKIILKAFGLRS